MKFCLYQIKIHLNISTSRSRIKHVHLRSWSNNNNSNNNTNNIIIIKNNSNNRLMKKKTITEIT